MPRIPDGTNTEFNPYPLQIESHDLRDRTFQRYRAALASYPGLPGVFVNRVQQILRRSRNGNLAT